MELLESYVLNCFSKVPSNDLPADDFKQFADGIYDTKEFKRMYYVKPVKDVCQVIIKQISIRKYSQIIL